MDNRKDVTVSLPAGWVETIDKNLDYGDSRSAWIREAVQERLVSEGYVEGNSKSATTAD